MGSGFTGRKSMRIARMGPVLSGDAKYGLKCSGLLFNFPFLNMFLHFFCDGNFRLTESAGMRTAIKQQENSWGAARGLLTKGPC